MFVGVEGGDHHLTTGAETTVTSQHEGVLAARLAYFLDLDGPNMAINTACSSGLVATHQACQSLRSGECDTALAAGVTLLLHPDTIAGMAGAGLLSPDGRCFAFDRRANGMVPAEAVAVVVLNGCRRPWPTATRSTRSPRQRHQLRRAHQRHRRTQRRRPGRARPAGP